MKKINIIAGIVVVIIIIVAFVQLTASNDSDDSVPQVTNTSVESPSLTLATQQNPNVVTINRIFLPTAGFVAIREIADGMLGQIAEVSPLLPAGETTNIQIQLPDGITTADSLIAVLYTDDGDGGFNDTLDTQVEHNGTIVAVDLQTKEAVDASLFTPRDTLLSNEKIAATVTYTNDGFTPQTITIEKGQTVSFVNNSDLPMWVASNVHPAHTDLSTFDQLSGSDPGTTYQYTFTKVGTWNYHDHISPMFGGRIIVTKPSAQLLPDLKKNKAGYFETNADTFASLADNPDVTMVNVHIPFAGKIPGTELSIPYNQTQQLLDALPKDKTAPIALYCRGGGMSAVASKDLVAAGYTNVYDLTGGMSAYEKSGRTLIK